MDIESLNLFKYPEKSAFWQSTKQSAEVFSENENLGKILGMIRRRSPTSSG
jgi:hypothetical protein